MRYAKYLMVAFMAFVLVALYYSATASSPAPITSPVPAPKTP